eukprot:1158117-Pelagomonas_calceolata.AAC.2
MHFVAAKCRSAASKYLNCILLSSITQVQKNVYRARDAQEGSSMLAKEPDGLLPIKGKKNAWVWEQYMLKEVSKASNSSNAGGLGDSKEDAQSWSRQQQQQQQHQPQPQKQQQKQVTYNCKHCQKILMGKNENRI